MAGTRGVTTQMAPPAGAAVTLTVVRRAMSNGSEDEESVDVCSEKFDPLKALYSKKVRLPNPNAPTLDNLAVYSAKQKQPAPRPAPPPKKPDVEQLAAKNRSRFLPHQRKSPTSDRRCPFVSILFSKIDTFSSPRKMCC